MTAPLDEVTNKKAEPTAEAEAARELVRLAREQGLSLTGPDGLLKQLTKTVIETALNEEITGHLGYEKNDPAGQGHGSGNVRNGSRPWPTPPGAWRNWPQPRRCGPGPEMLHQASQPILVLYREPDSQSRHIF
jgi:hypothetical protein